GSVHDLVTRHADDLTANNALNTARLNYLQTTAEANANAAASTRVSQNLSSYVKGKTAAEKPQTLTVPNSDTAYQWNPTTRSWQRIAGTGGGGSGSGGTVNVTDNSGRPINIPASVAPYYNTSSSGVGYADLSNVQGTAKEKTAIVN